MISIREAYEFANGNTGFYDSGDVGVNVDGLSFTETADKFIQWSIDESIRSHEEEERHDTAIFEAVCSGSRSMVMELMNEAADGIWEKIKEMFAKLAKWFMNLFTKFRMFVDTLFKDGQKYWSTYSDKFKKVKTKTVTLTTYNIRKAFKFLDIFSQKIDMGDILGDIVEEALKTGKSTLTLSKVHTSHDILSLINEQKPSLETELNTIKDITTDEVKDVFLKTAGMSEFSELKDLIGLETKESMGISASMDGDLIKVVLTKSNTRLKHIESFRKASTKMNDINKTIDGFKKELKTQADTNVTANKGDDKAIGEIREKEALSGRILEKYSKLYSSAGSVITEFVNIITKAEKLMCKTAKQWMSAIITGKDDEDADLSSDDTININLGNNGANNTTTTTTP